MKDRPPAQGSDHWLSMINQASDWFEGPLGQQLLAQEKHILTEELARCFGSYLVHNGPFGGEPVQPENIKRSVRLGAPLCRAWKFTARSRLGRLVSTPLMWWCCSMLWTSVCPPMDYCVKRRVACVRAVIC